MVFHSHSSLCRYFNVVYMVSFVLIMSFLVLNLFVAVIIDNFSYLTEDSSTLNVHALYDLVARWSQRQKAGALKRRNDLLVAVTKALKENGIIHLLRHSQNVFSTCTTLCRNYHNNLHNYIASFGKPSCCCVAVHLLSEKSIFIFQY